MKIDSKNLNWYAAFHNASHHPHVHIMVYSKEPSEGYLSKKAIQNMRSELAHDIFRQEFLQIYEEQAESREALLKKTEQVLSQLEQQKCFSLPDGFGEQLLQLSERLRHTSGKKVYGYLKADVKRLVDGIVDQLAETDEIKEAYQVWVEWQQATSEVYGTVKTVERKLSEEKKLKVIKNMVLRSALALLPEPVENKEIEDVLLTSKVNLETEQGRLQRTAKQQADALLRDILKLFSSNLQEIHHKQQAGIDKKRRQKLREKRAAAGQKTDDTMESQTI